ncbi:MAG TPA: glycogen synthase, partial [Opitutaceae bacterium]|nr:glycogen synthase [Opitutaceae bacterium]
QPNAGTGIMFAPTAEGLLSGLNRALKLFGNRAGYQAVQRRCMQRDFSWTKAAAGYEALYDENL